MASQPIGITIQVATTLSFGIEYLGEVIIARPEGSPGSDWRAVQAALDDKDFLHQNAEETLYSIDPGHLAQAVETLSDVLVGNNGQTLLEVVTLRADVADDACIRKTYRQALDDALLKAELLADAPVEVVGVEILNAPKSTDIEVILADAPEPWFHLEAALRVSLSCTTPSFGYTAPAVLDGTAADELVSAATESTTDTNNEGASE